MLVFTDGWSNKGPDPEEMSRNAKNAGFTVYTVFYEVCLAFFSHSCSSKAHVFNQRIVVINSDEEK
ncbi:unnamed protein product [Gongylonema pulchrum]|uniref:VWFA domain-containing protein n=1 Tax=Gongylonema pulchrum TaxID=637853 RepID=A0A183D740_9BILA|nr:unnamed protein product [Gongylonema pulchrum]